MFGKMTVGKKIASGFAVVLILTGILGYIGFNAVDKIQQITDKASDTNRLVNMAKDARVLNLLYMRKGQQSDLDENAKVLKEIHEQIQITHDKFMDPTDRAGIMQAKDQAKKYQDALAHWVQLDNQQSQAEDRMASLAQNFITECDELGAEEKAELAQLKDKSRKDQEDKLLTVELAAELRTLSKTCRVEVIKYMQTKEAQYLQQNDQTVKQIADAADQLIAALKDPKDQQLIAELKNHAMQYKQGLGTWQEYDSAQDKLSKELDAIADKFQDTCEKLAHEQASEITELVKSGQVQQQVIQTKLTQVQTAETMIQLAKECRILEKDYMVKQDEASNKKLLQTVAQLNNQCTKLLNSLKEEVDRERVRELTDDLQQYEQIFKKWASLFDSKSQTESKMIEHANVFFAQCDTFQTEQQKELVELKKTLLADEQRKQWTSDTAGELIIQAGIARRHEMNFMMHQDTAYLDKNHESVAKILELCDGLVEKLLDPRDKKTVDDLKKLAVDYQKSVDQWGELMGEKYTSEGRLVTAVKDFVDECQHLGEGQQEKMLAQINSSSVLTSTGAILTIIIGSVLAFFIASGIIRPLRRIIDGMENGASQVSQASDQVSSSSQSMAEGASEQASSLEETSASLEQMNATVRQNAQNAQSANSMAEEARSMSVKGNEAMKRLTQTISKIKDSSDQTASILKTIDEIAFQTNLLALNAAVEAARAGEAGKGFAVVAEEVRSLAQRSAEASKSTAQLIEDACRNADQGVDVASEAEASLTQIDAAVTKVTELINEVSSASNEQADGIDQVTKAVSQMDQVTQANAANSEESAAASEELSAQAEELNSMVDELVGMVMGQRKVNRSMRSTPAKVTKSHAPKPRKVAASHASSKSQASTVIPLDDDDDMSDF
ncbi:MAG: hypothetical protein CMJ19_09465 [Phycisphaeraceae bacterium]|nr:hypothetical protein [Phycisphaeraceae bacterium]